MKKVREINSFTLYKRTLALVLAVVMVFNLSYDIFAQNYQVKWNSKGGPNVFPQTQQFKNQGDKLSQELEKVHQAEEAAKLLGYTYEAYQKDIKAYAKKNNIDINTIDMSASWQAYTMEILKYDNDYKTLSKLFNKKTINEVITDSNYYLKAQNGEIKYDGKKYNRAALLHAALHNLATRNNTGYVSQGVWVFSKESEQKISFEQKVGVIKHMYKIISKEGFYPQDRQVLWAFAYNIVENGKKYFDNKTYKADIIPSLSNADDRQKAEQGKEKRQSQANAVADAVSLLPVLSQSSNEKTKSTQVIYDLARKVMRDDYGTIGITIGAEALIALRTDESLNKLYTLLTEDLYRSLGTEVAMYFFDSFSVDEWVKRVGGSFGNGIKNGIGQYHNAIARRFLYIDPKKNSADKIRIASRADESLEAYYNVVYTDILEDIGKTLGAYSQNSKVAALNDKLVAKYIKEIEVLKQRQIENSGNISPEKSQTPFEREKALHTSLVVGILAKTKVKNDNLTKAAKIIYNGHWWDLNEATQRDKNNIAAKYLGAKAKGYNAQKQKEFAALTKVKTIGRFMDVFVQAAMMGKLILSVPSIISRIGNIASRITRGFKVVFKENVIKAKPAQVQPAEKPALKPAEPAKVAEPARTPGAEPAKVAEPAKAPVVDPVAEPVRVPAEPASVNNSVEVPHSNAWINENAVTPLTQAQITKAAQSVKSEMLAKYYQRPAAMAIFPFGIFADLGRRITAFLTNRPYLSDAKIKIVKDIADDVARELGSKNLSEAELKTQIEERVAQRIQSDSRFTEAEKAELLKEQQPKAAEEAFQTELERKAKAAEEARQAKAAEEARQAKAAEEYYKMAQRAIHQFDSKQALEYYSKAIELDPTNAKYYFARAELKNLKREKASALKDYNKAIELDPNNAEYYYYRGKSKIGYDNLGALKDYNKAIELDPNNAEYYYDRALFKRLIIKDYQGALADFTEAIKLDPTNSQYYFQRGNIKRILNDLDGAIEDLKMATRYNLEFGLYEEFLAEYTKDLKIEKAKASEARQAKAAEEAKIKAKQKAAEEAIRAEEARYLENYQKALEHYNEAILREPKNPYYYFKRAELKASKLTDVQGALADYTEAIKLDPTNAEYYHSRGKLKIAGLRDKNGAMSDYNKAIQLDPTNAQYYHSRGNLKIFHLRDKKGAISDYDKAIQLDPTNDKFYYGRALAKWFRAEDLASKESAIEDVKQALKYNPGDEVYSKMLTDWTEELKVEKAKAAEEARQAKAAEETKIKPEQKAKSQAEEYYDKAGEAQYEKKYQEALEYYNKAIELDPTNAKYYYMRSGLKEFCIKDYQGALADRTKAIKLDPTNSEYYFSRSLFKAYQLNDLEGAIEDIKMAIKYDPKHRSYKETLESFTKELNTQKASEARQAKAAEEAKIKAEQEARQAKAAEETRIKAAEEARQAKAVEEARIKAEQEARQAEFTRQEMDKDATQRAAEKRSREKLATQKAYDDFEETISKESRQEVKAQYLIKQARLLRNANGTGRESIIIEGSEVSYKKAAMLSYDRAIEYAPTPEIKAKYLSERASFKYVNGDLEGAMKDLQTAGELTPEYKGKSL